MGGGPSSSQPAGAAAAATAADSPSKATRFVVANMIKSRLYVDARGHVIHRDLCNLLRQLPAVQKSKNAIEALNIIQAMDTNSDGQVELSTIQQKLERGNGALLSRAMQDLCAGVSMEGKHKHDNESKIECAKEEDDGDDYDEDDDLDADEPHPPPRLSQMTESGDAEAVDGEEEDEWGAEGGADADWGDEEDGGNGETETRDARAQDGPKKMIIGEFQILDDDAVQYEVEQCCKTLTEQIGVSFGHAVHILRTFKWEPNLAVTKWFDDGEMAKTKACITYPSSTEDGSSSSKSDALVQCMQYSDVGNQMKTFPKAELRRGAKRSRTQSPPTDPLVETCKDLIKLGSNLGEILSKLREEGKQPREIQKAFQRAQGILAGESLGDIKMTECEESMGRVPASKATRLSCGHWRCNECWNEALTAELQSGRDSLYMRCTACSVDPETNKEVVCQERVPRETFSKVLGDKATERYDIWVRRNFMEIRKDIQCCPKPGCTFTLRKLGVTDLAKCQCGHEFCFQCREIPHNPVPCAQFQDFQRRCASDYQQTLWFQMNTMKCPNCHISIEKNRQCLHMTCKCGYEWCWACRKEWSNVNHNFFNCPNYRSEQEGKEIGHLQARAAKELRKLKWYQKQMDVSRDDMKSAQYILERVNGEVNAMEPKDRREYEFLLCAIRDYIRAKKLMIQLYIIAFYFKGKKVSWTCSSCLESFKMSVKTCPTCKVAQPKDYGVDSKKKALFEMQQKMMVEVTTKIMDMIGGKWTGWKCVKCNFENDQHAQTCATCSEPATTESNTINIRAFLSEKKKVQGVAGTMTKFVDKVTNDIEEGSYDSFILDTPDDSIQGWFCIKCDTMNDFESTVCKCTACQVHGELSCLRCSPGNSR